VKVWLYRRRYSDQGGAERFTQRLAKALNARGYEVWIAAEDWLPAGEEEYQVRKVPSHGLKAYAKYCRDHISRDRDGVVFSLERTFRQHIYRAGDGVHASWLQRRSPSQKGIHRYWTKWSQRHRTILDFEKQLFTPESTDWVVANSPMVREEIIQFYGYPEDRIRVIHPGVNLKDFVPCRDSQRREELRKRFGVPKDEIVWCFVGSGFERKGLRWAIEIASRQKASRIWLLVLGKGKRNVYESQAERLGLGSRLMFLSGDTPALDVYHASDAFILPTIYDPCSNATLEASACGLPVITTTGNGASYWSRGVVLEDLSKTEENVDRIAPIVLPWSYGTDVEELRQKLDEIPCWNALQNLIQLVSSSCQAIH
jgi:UDP-glucose:(heptosyl)LPS alpha-1,3-glucosyltransferase